jgi:hypothetical protein
LIPNNSYTVLKTYQLNVIFPLYYQGKSDGIIRKKMKNLSLYTPVYSLALCLSAALLFSVQPMFSKMILPLLGGTPQVWNTAMLFFQVMLLGGYTYAHVSSKYLGIRTQGMAHIALLVLFIVVLPFSIPAGWIPPVTHDPTLWQLSLMTITVGGPFFVLAGSAPMLQRWFTASGHPDAKNPYFLYGASNLGSMTALLAYPTIIEPLLTLAGQSIAWEIGYIGLIIFIALSAWLVRSAKPEKQKKAKDEIITWKRRGLWLVLAFIPSSLMLGVTTFITTDIAAVPLLWIIPLALYVGTFIIVFARKQLISQKTVLNIQGLLLVVLLIKMIGQFTFAPGFLIPLHLALFFFCALACHMELSALRPSAGKLTEFYLVMSLGGALGGFFNAIIAPVLFIIPIEYPLILVAAIFMRNRTDAQSFQETLHSFKKIWKARGLDSIFSAPFILGFIIVFSTLSAFALENTAAFKIFSFLAGGALVFFMDRRWVFTALTCFALFLFPPGYFWGNHYFTKILHRDRNFFGVLKVAETKPGERILLHGTTNHGAQPLDLNLRLMPTSYYSTRSPLNDPFLWLNRKEGDQKIAVVGLGIGVTACFKKSGRHYDFFEIDPAVVRIAQNKNYFTYLSDCNSSYSIIPGDGRLTMKNRQDHSYDMILLDAFTSDNIPAHLLTVEAIRLYLQKLKPAGILLLHISNNYLDMEPVLAQAAKAVNVPGYARASLDGKMPDTDILYEPAHFFSISENKAYNQLLERRGWTKGQERKGIKLWSDQYSNIVSVIGNRTAKQRLGNVQKEKKK